MNSGIIRIQKGYLLIEKARNEIKQLYEVEDIQQDKEELLQLKSKEEELNSQINEIKDKVFEYENKIVSKEKEIAGLIKIILSNPKSESKKVKDGKRKKEELEEENIQLKKEITKFFIDMDALKEKIQNQKILYNEMEKRLYKKLEKQNKKIVKYEDKIKEIEKKIRKIRRDIDSDILSVYDKKRQKSIVVMSEILDDKCTQCGIQIDEEKIKLAYNNEIVECYNCGKILYIENNKV